MSGPVSSPSSASNFGVISASDTECHSSSASQSDSDFEVVLVTHAAANLALSDSDSGSLVSTPTDLNELSDDEHIFVPNIVQSAPNTPRPPVLAPPRLATTPRPTSAVVARPIIEHGHDSEASDREDDSSVGSLYDSDSDEVEGVRARARTLATTSDRLEEPVSLRSTTSLGTAHANGSAVTIRPAILAQPSSTHTLRRSAPAGMHTPIITTNTIMGIVASAPLSPPIPSDGEEIPYVPFTAAPTAVSVPVPVITLPTPAQPSAIQNATPPPPEPPIPAGNISRKEWCKMNVARLQLRLKPLKHALRERLNAERSYQNRASQNVAKGNPQANAQASSSTMPRSTGSRLQPQFTAKVKVANPLVAPHPTVGGSPMSSEDESSRARISMFSPVNDVSVRSDSPDEEAYNEAIRQLDE
jgi:hypothetical protein